MVLGASIPSLVSEFDMKADHSESDRIVSISRIEPLLSRQLPRVTKATRSDKDVVAKATITHSESGVKEKKTERQLLRDLSKLEPKIRKGKRNGKKTAGRGPTVDTSRAKASGDVVRLAVRELGWREVYFALVFNFSWLPLQMPNIIGGASFGCKQIIQTSNIKPRGCFASNEFQ